MHDFDEKLREGQHYEGILDRYFAREYSIMAVTDFIQRQGKDRIFSPLAGGQPFGVEYKADSVAARTNNAFMETESVADQKMGWALTSQAHALVYYIPPRCVAYWLPLARIRAALPSWRSQFRHAGAENADYITKGVLVPIGELESVAERTFLIPPDGDPDSSADGKLQTQHGGTWSSPTWARGFGTPLSWTTLEARLRVAQRIWPHLRYRIAAGE